MEDIHDKMSKGEKIKLEKKVLTVLNDLEFTEDAKTATIGLPSPTSNSVNNRNAKLSSIIMKNELNSKKAS